MATLEYTQKCAFCRSYNPPYTCPRCQQPYCKLACYQCLDHQTCSEIFYEQWVKSCLSVKDSSDKGRRKMENILTKLHHKELDSKPFLLDSDDDDDDDEDDDDDNDEDDDDDNDENEDAEHETHCSGQDRNALEELNEKLITQLKINRPDELWDNLTRSEKEVLKTVLDKEPIQLWNPWWNLKEPIRKLVSDIEEPEKEFSSCVPDVPKELPKLHTLTSRRPSDSIQYLMLNILAAYAFTARHYNGEHADEPEESTEMLLKLSPLLQKNFDVCNSAESIYLLLEDQHDPTLDQKTLCLVFHDVCKILEGPEHDNNCHYVSAALSDIIHILKKAKQNLLSEKKKTIKMAIKKIEFLLSWNQDYGCHVLKQNIPVLTVEIASLTENINSLQKVEKYIMKQVGEKPKVMEI